MKNWLRNNNAGKTILRAYKKIATPFFQALSGISRKFAAFSHKMLFYAEWCIDNPEQFDHNIDLYYQWPVKDVPHWLERGVYNLLALQSFEKPVVLELCCGEGFNTRFFYSYASEQIVAGDFDEAAIREARRKNQRKNIAFKVMDIRDGIPETVRGGVITNVIWDAAIEHFTPEEIDAIMKRIHQVLSGSNGILSGHTIKERDDGKSLEQHEYEFKSKEDLRRFFLPYFKNVTVWETAYPDRHNFYFWASDGVLPFSKEWKRGLL